LPEETAAHNLDVMPQALRYQQGQADYAEFFDKKTG
jgi:hypothetical protein